MHVQVVACRPGARRTRSTCDGRSRSCVELRPATWPTTSPTTRRRRVRSGSRRDRRSTCCCVIRLTTRRRALRLDAVRRRCREARDHASGRLASSGDALRDAVHLAEEAASAARQRRPRRRPARAQEVGCADALPIKLAAASPDLSVRARSRRWLDVARYVPEDARSADRCARAASGQRCSTLR